MGNMQSAVVYDDGIKNDNEAYNDNIVEKPNRYSYTSFEDVPLIIGAEQLAAILGISRSGAYQLLRRKDFPTVHIGKRMIVPRDLLIKWLEAQAAS